MKKFWTSFKKFAFKGNMIDLAVAVVIGGAFGAIVTSLVNDIIMPLVGVLLGRVSFSNLFWAVDGNTYETVEAAKAAGAGVVNFGAFINAFVNFMIIGLTIFIVIKAFAKLSELRRHEEPTPPPAPKRACPYCRLEIADEATRCPHCTSQLE